MFFMPSAIFVVRLRRNRMTVMKSFKTWLVLVGLLIVGCASVQAQASERAGKRKSIYYRDGKVLDEPPNRNADTIKIATGQTEGTYFAIGNFLGKAVSHQFDKTIIEVVETSGSVGNLEGVEEGLYDFGIVQSDVLDFYHGREKYDKFKIVGAIYHEPVYILVRRKLRLSSIEELRGKKVAIGLAKSGTQHTSKTILGIFGISLNEVDPCEPNYVETAELLSEENIHAAFIVSAGIPKEIKDRIRENEVYIMHIGRNDLVKIASTDPYLYRLLDVNGRAYGSNDSACDANEPQGDDKKLRTISITSVLIAKPKTDARIVHKLAGQLYEFSRLCNRSYRKRQKDGGTRVIDPNIAGLEWVDYSFQLYGERGNDKLFHETALGYYKETKLWWPRYWFDKAKRWIFPLSLVPLLIFLRSIWKKRPRWIRNLFWLCLIISIVYIYSCIIVGLYILIFLFESNIDNPEITGKPFDLVKMFLLSLRFGELFALTMGGKIFRGVTQWIGGVFGIITLGKLGADFVQNKVREALKVILKNSYKHVVICNWTPKAEGVIGELRSDAIRKKRRIIVIARADEQRQADMKSCAAEYDDVCIFPGDPTSVETFKHEDLNICAAKAVLILADDKHEDDPDIRSLKILTSISNVLGSQNKKVQKKQRKAKKKRPNFLVELLLEIWHSPRRVRENRKERFQGKPSKKKPNIIVELSKPGSAMEERMREEGADKVISYADITHKLLAQAIITPSAINFVREILTVEKKSNEVYELDIEEMFQKIHSARKECTFQDFANEITNKYKKKYHNPITVIGVRSEGKLHINPKGKDFSKIYEDGTIDTAVVLAWKEPKELKM